MLGTAVLVGEMSVGVLSVVSPWSMSAVLDN